MAPSQRALAVQGRAACETIAFLPAHRDPCSPSMKYLHTMARITGPEASLPNVGVW